MHHANLPSHYLSERRGKRCLLTVLYCTGLDMYSTNVYSTGPLHSPIAAWFCTNSFQLWLDSHTLLYVRHRRRFGLADARKFIYSTVLYYTVQYSSKRRRNWRDPFLRNNKHVFDPGTIGNCASMHGIERFVGYSTVLYSTLLIKQIKLNSIVASRANFLSQINAELHDHGTQYSTVLLYMVSFVLKFKACTHVLHPVLAQKYNLSTRGRLEETVSQPDWELKK